MGWGLLKGDRDAVLQACLISTSQSKAKPKTKTERASSKDGRKPTPQAGCSAPKQKTDVAIADMNAKLRQKAVDISGGAPLSMHRVVRNVVREVAKDAGEHMILVFDTPHCMPAVRTVLWKSRYGPREGGSAAPPSASEIQKSVEFCRQASESSFAERSAPPTKYSVIFTPGAAKAAAWNAMAHIARRHAAVAAAELGIRATVIDAQNVVFDTAGPGTPLLGWTDVVQSYGEADLKIYALGQAMSHAKKSVALHSVDTDLILQAVATVGDPGPPRGAPAAKAWVPRNDFVIKLKTCIVDGRKLIQHFGGRHTAKRLNTAFWFIMAGGTDYSRPASDQGYAKRSMVDAAHPLVISAAPFSTTGPADARKTLATLKKTRKVSRTVCGKAKSSGRSLKRALEQAAAVVRYYGLQDTDPDVKLFE